MTLEAIDTLAPAGTGFAVANQTDIKGGAHSVATFTDLATQPATSRRAAGMLVLVRDTNEVYALGNDLTTWTLASGAGGSAYWLDPVVTLGDDTPPGSPGTDERHIAGTLPGGAWTGHANEIAVYNGASWEFEAPVEGLVVYAHDDDLLYKYSGSAWVEAAVPTARQVIAGNGLSGGGSLTGDVTLNVAAGDSTISVAADAISVGTIANANVATNAAVAVSKLAGGSDNHVLYTSTATPTWGAMTDAIHGTRGGGTQHSAVNNTAAGFAPTVGASGTVLQSTGTAGTWAAVGPSNITDGTLPWTKLVGVGSDTREPSGFFDLTTSTISRTDSGPTRTFTIAPVSGSFSFYANGTKYTKSGAETVTWTDTEGVWFFYYDASGVLTATQSTTTWSSVIGGNGACVAALYWDATNKTSILFFEERHGLMNGPTHLHFHNAFGTQWVSGGTLGDFVIGNGSLATHAQLSVSTCTYRDEDIQHVSATLNAPASIPIFYRSGASGLWRKKTADSYPVIYSGTAGYTGASGRLAYNSFIAGSWGLTEVGNGDYVLVHYFATADSTTPIIGLQGQADYATLNAAEAAATTEIKALAGVLNLLSTEYTPLGTVCFQTGNTYSNVPKAKIVQINGANYIDFRGNKITGTGAAVSDHGNLTGLADDDHTQYLLTAGTRETTGNLSFAMAVVSPTIAQTNETTAATNGDTLTIRAQNSTAASTTGGTLALVSGTGGSGGTDGSITAAVGATTRLEITPTFSRFTYGDGTTDWTFRDSTTDSSLAAIYGKSLASSPTGSNYVLASKPGSTLLNSTTTVDLRINNSSRFKVTTTTVTFNLALMAVESAIVTPRLYQVDDATNSVTGDAFTIQAQNATGTTSTGGQLALTSGTGTSAAGSVVIQTGGTTRCTVAAASTVFNHGSGTICTIGASSVGFGATPATTGIVRMPNNDGVYFRNAANNADIAGIRCDTSDEILIGNGSTDFLTVTPTLITCAAPLAMGANDISIDGAYLKSSDNGSGAASTLAIKGGNGTSAGGAVTITGGDASNASTTGANVTITTGAGTSANGSCTITAGSTVLTCSPTVITCVANSATRTHGLAGLALTGQTADITTTNIATTPGAGLYRLDYYVEITTAGGGTIDVTLGFTDTIGATTTKIVNGLSVAATNRASGSYVFWLASGSPTYATAFAGKTGSPVYTLRAQLERIR